MNYITTVQRNRTFICVIYLTAGSADPASTLKMLAYQVYYRFQTDVSPTLSNLWAKRTLE